MDYLGKHKEPLINEDETFKASMLGPILLELYDLLKVFNSHPIHEYFFPLTEIKEDKKESIALKDTWENLKDKKDYELIELTHRENGAWAKVYDEIINRTITNQSILEEYEMIPCKTKVIV
jgi:uncharacterized phage-associated protein